jgi:hypothetical protein
MRRRRRRSETQLEGFFEISGVEHAEHGRVIEVLGLPPSMGIGLGGGGSGGGRSGRRRRG